MIAKLLRKVGLLIGGGVVLFAFLLVAQVNLDDLRHYLGDLLRPYGPTVLVGGLYVVSPEGHLESAPPVCRPEDKLVKENFETKTSRVSLRNSLGYSVPVIRQLSAFISSADGTAVSVVEISGHTLVAEHVSNTQLIAEDLIPRYLEKLFEARPDCEDQIRSHWMNKECVALVHRVSAAGETLLGYTYNRYCMLPELDVDDYDRGPLIAPQPVLSITARLSALKDFIGLIDTVAPLNQAKTQSASSS